jgi:MSHA biogenesis protein MshI
VCPEPDGIAIASIKRDQKGRVILQQANFYPSSSTDESQNLLEQGVRQEHLQHSSCVVVLPVDSYQLMQVDVTGITEEELRDAVRWQISERLDYPAIDAVIDLFEIAPFSSEKKPAVYAVAAQQKILRERVEMTKKSDLVLASIDIPEFALRNICDLFSEDERGLAILLLLEQRGVLVIVRDGVLYLVRWLSIGMNDLLPFAEVDDESLTAQLDAIVLEIQRSFDYCESNFHLPIVSRLLVAQTQREIPAVVDYLNDYLTTAVESFSFENILDLPEGSEQIQLNRCLLSIGGALRQEDN